MPFPFTAVCDLLQSLENDHKRKRQARGSVKITTNWFAEHRGLVHAPETDPVALLSTLLPERRSDRVFSIKEKSLERIVATACGLGTRKDQLRRWETEPRAGLDFAECVESVLAQSPNDIGEPVSVEDIDITLQQLASTVSFSSPSVRSSRPPAVSRTSSKEDHLLASLFRRLSPRDAKWLCRVILKSFLPVIVPESTVYSQFNPLLPTVLKVHDNFAVAVALLHHHLRAHQSRGLTFTREDVPRIIKPRVGVKVGRQQWCKARGIKHSLEMGTGWMSCEAKMDGEYCQIHVDLSKSHSHIQIFSKSGKDSTMDRSKLHPAIRNSLRLGRPECKFKQHCILEGELVVYNEIEKKIAGFEKIRKHVNRSGRFIGTDQDSQAHSYERLMIVYFDVLLIDDESMLNLRHSERRKRLSALVQCQEGQAALVRATDINFQSSSQVAEKDLRAAFASCIRNGEEGLVLKPDEPYFSFGLRQRSYQSCCLKLKKGYVKGLGDVGDFAVVGGRFDPTAAKTLGIANVKFTHFYLGCLLNKQNATRFGAKPAFKVVSEVQLTDSTMAEHFRLHVFLKDVPPEENDTLVIEAPQGVMKGNKMSAVFQLPAVFDLTCFDFYKEPNTNFWSPRFPYVSKVHVDRTWGDCVTFDELQKLAKVNETRTDEAESQELVEWIEKLEQSELRRKRKKETRITDTAKTVTSAPGESHASVVEAPVSVSTAAVQPVPETRTIETAQAVTSAPHASQDSVGQASVLVATTAISPVQETRITDTAQAGNIAPDAAQRSVGQASIEASTVAVQPVISSDRNDAAVPPVRLDRSFAENSQTSERSSLSIRKRRRDASPVTTRHARRRTEAADLIRSQTSSNSQGSIRQPLEDITSTPSSQGNARPSSNPRLSRSQTFHEEPKTAKSSPMPARLPNAASFQTASAFTSPSKALRNVHEATVAAPKSSGKSRAKSRPVCEHAGAACALASTFILLSPCVRTMLLLTETLLPPHWVAVITQDIPSWHASARWQLGSSVNLRRLVLVESRRKKETREFMKALDASPSRLPEGQVMRAAVFDWRLMEAITDAELAQKSSDGSTRQKVGTGAWERAIWEKYYVGEVGVRGQ